LIERLISKVMAFTGHADFEDDIYIVYAEATART
jgi:hypothetical protein